MIFDFHSNIVFEIAHYLSISDILSIRLAAKKGQMWLNVAKEFKKFTIGPLSINLTIDEAQEATISIFRMLNGAKDVIIDHTMARTGFDIKLLGSNLLIIDIGYNPSVTDHTLMALSECKLLKVINISDCHNFTDNGLQYISHAKVIHMNWCGQVSDEGLKWLSTVNSIKLYKCKKITDIGLSYLKSVTNVELGGNKLITDVGIQYLIQRPSLTNLELRGLNISDMALIGAIHLKRLYLSKCGKITGQFFSQMNKLNHLLAFDCSIGDKAILSIPNKLRKFVINDNEAITDAALAKVGPDLYTFGISGCFCCPNITDEGIKHLGPHCTYVSISSSTLTTKCCQYLANVVQIKLIRCPNIANEGLMWLTKAKYISIHRCKLIDSGAFKYMSGASVVRIENMRINEDDFAHLANMEAIEISECDNITLSGLYRLRMVKKIMLERSLVIEQGPLGPQFVFD
jgi:Leucine Rich repeat